MIQHGIYKEQRVTVLVDVQNMYYSAKNLYNSKVKFEEILRDCVRGRVLVRALAYAIKADVRDESNFHEALENIGFEVKLKDLLVFYGGHKKGDWDIGIAMDAVRAADKADVVVVVSGDGDFKELYEYLRGKGCRVEVMAFGRTASSSVKEYVDLFIDMDKNKKYLIPLKHHGTHTANGQNGTMNKDAPTLNSGQTTFSVKQTVKPIEASLHGQELSMNISATGDKSGEFDILKVNQDQPDTFGQPVKSNGMMEVNAGNTNSNSRKNFGDSKRRFNSNPNYRGNNANKFRGKNRHVTPAMHNSANAPARKIENAKTETIVQQQPAAKIIEEKAAIKEVKSEGLLNKLMKKIKK